MRILIIVLVTWSVASVCGALLFVVFRRALDKTPPDALPYERRPSRPAVEPSPTRRRSSPRLPGVGSHVVRH